MSVTVGTSWALSADNLKLNTQSAFPRSGICRTIAAAAADIQTIIQAPPEMIIAQCLGIAAVACQGLYDVKLLHDSTVPCSLNLVTLGDSGERKSASNDCVVQALIDFEAELISGDNIARGVYEREMLIWTLKKKALDSDYKKAIRNHENVIDMEIALELHALDMPKQVKGRRILYRDFTPQALKNALRDNYPNGLILSDEAGNYFNGSMIREFQILNDLWGGKDLIVDRATTGSFIVTSPRISHAIMLQPQIFRESMMKKQVELRDSGLLARFLMCYPASTQGFRSTNPVERQIRSGLEHFHLRIANLLRRTYIEGENHVLEREVLRFSFEAQNVLREYDSRIEINLRAGGRFCEMRDFASKMIEHTCRVAAIYHALECRPGVEIGVDDVHAAFALIDWYSVQFYELVVLKMAPGQVQRDAEVLLEWFKEKARLSGAIYPVGKQNLLQYGPNQLRSKERIDPALGCLIEQRNIITFQNPPTTPKGKWKYMYQLAQEPVVSDPYLSHFNYN